MEDSGAEGHANADSALIAGVQSGDKAAFDKLYLSAYESLIAFAYSFVHDGAAAEDIVQEVFLAIWRSRTNWRPATSVRAYLFTAVRNRALKHTRHERVASSALSRVEGMPSPAALPDEAMETEDRAANLRRVISSLPERYATALKLRWQDEFTYPEIAAVLEISPQAVRTLLLRIQDRLKYLLEP